VDDLGLHELGDGEAVLLVEWGDAVEALLPPDHLVIELTSDDDDARAIAVTSVGSSWDRRAEHLEAALLPWRRA
jgi:tRNA A37 threonylcarbamoyladenosine biosynthesis protein TsaE